MITTNEGREKNTIKTVSKTFKIPILFYWKNRFDSLLTFFVFKKARLLKFCNLRHNLSKLSFQGGKKFFLTLVTQRKETRREREREREACVLACKSFFVEKLFESKVKFVF